MTRNFGACRNLVNDVQQPFYESDFDGFGKVYLRGSVLQCKKMSGRG